MRKLASIVEIATCEPIPDTDRLSVATMKGSGWRVVTGRNEFTPGDKAVYFEIDSYLPTDDARYSFIAERCTKVIRAKDGTELDRGIKIRTVKLRGIISQGLLMPLANFPEISGETGTDVTSLLRIRHYDEVMETWAEKCQGACGIPSEAYGKFPTDYCPKTDEERIQNLGYFFTEMVGRKFEVTEKSDGSSCTMMYMPSANPERPFRVCSRNNDLKRETAHGVSPLWKIAEQYEVERHLREYYEQTGKELAVQGEYVGIGIQKNRDGLKCNDWLVFRIFNITDGEFMPPPSRREFCRNCGFHHVKVIDENLDVFAQFKTCDELLKFAEGKTDNGHEREGLVFKATDEIKPFVSFKAVSNRYLMGDKD